MLLPYRLGASVAVAMGAAALAVATCSSCEDGGGDGGGGSDATAPDAKVEGGGGTGGAKADADAAGCAPLPEYDGTVLTDPKIWQCVADDRGCSTYVANLTPDPFPKLAWKSCGPGCDETDAVLPIGKENTVLWGGSGATEGLGDIVVRLRVYAGGIGPTHWVFRLEDGMTVYAVRNGGKCASVGWTNDGALAVPTLDDPHDFVRTVRALDMSPAAKLEWSSWVKMPGPLPTGFFSWEDGWGMTFTDGSLRVVTSTDATTFTTIDTGAPVYEVASRNRLVVWPGHDATGQRLVKAWGLQSGLQTLWSTAQALDGSASDYVNSVAVSDKFLVWIVVDGPGYKFTKAQMLWSPFATVPGDVTVSEGPAIPATYSLHELRTGGDFAASEGCFMTGPESGECAIFVIQLSSKKLWKIPRRPGRSYLDVMAVSDQYVLVGERNAGGSTQIIRRLVRFHTAELDALESAW
jgi:hypothetical protein